MPCLTASLVVYRTPVEELRPLFESLQREPETAAWIVIDNAATEDAASSDLLRQVVEAHGGRYLPSKNIGFGAGHNLALASLRNTPSEFHLMVNPDISFGPEVLPDLIQTLRQRPQTGWIMPKILYPDGRIQPLCKLLPTPLDFALRRFLPSFLAGLTEGRVARYEMRGIEDTASTTVPFLSGCFIFVRRAMLEVTGGFDERYFMYMEDVDLCRRFRKHGELLYWPAVSVVHAFQRGSHTNLRLTFIHLQSSFRYFNRWGWIFDAERRRLNKIGLAALPASKLTSR